MSLPDPLLSKLDQLKDEFRSALSSAVSERDNVTQALADAQAAKAELVAKAEQLQQDKVELTAALEATAKAQQRLSSSLDDCEMENSQLKLQLQSQAEEIESLKGVQSQSSQSSQAQLATIQDLEEQCSSLKSQIEQSTSGAEQLKLQLRESLASEFGEREQALQKEREALLEERDFDRIEFASKSAEWDRQNEFRERRHQELQETLEVHCAQMESSQAEIQRLNSEVISLTEHLTTKSDKAELLAASSRAKAAEEEVHRLQGELTAKSSELEAATNVKLREELETLIKNVRAETAAGHPVEAEGESRGENQALIAILKTELMNLLRVSSRLGSENSELRYTIKQLQETSAEQSGVVQTAEEHFRELQRLAFEDRVTGLPNLGLGIKHLEQQIRSLKTGELSLALSRVDVQGLHAINRRFGRAAGDELLAQVAQVLNGCLSAEDVLLRGRDDDFWIVSSHQGPPANRDRVLSNRLAASLNQCLETLRQPLQCRGQVLRVLLSFGISLGTVDSTPEVLESQCNAALSVAKKQEGGRIALYQAEMDAKDRRQAELEPLLRDSIAKQQLAMRFQPIYDLRTRSYWGCEGLLRWDHPQKGLMECRHFIDLACQTGLVVGLGNWVFQNLPSLGDQLPKNTKVSLNCSVSELLQADFARKLTKMMESIRSLRPDCFVIELREDDLLDENPALFEVVKGLRRWNVSVAVDDFNGRAPLQRLQELKVSYLKLHPELLAKANSPSGLKFLQALSAMAVSWQCELVAKHVEGIEQLKILGEIGCHLAQGTLLGQPVKVGDLVDHLNFPTLRPTATRLPGR
jgi:diguanylate cyclase (GGDEF)-like protein